MAKRTHFAFSCVRQQYVHSLHFQWIKQPHPSRLEVIKTHIHVVSLYGLLEVEFARIVAPRCSLVNQQFAVHTSLAIRTFCSACCTMTTGALRSIGTPSLSVSFGRQNDKMATDIFAPPHSRPTVHSSTGRNNWPESCLWSGVDQVMLVGECTHLGASQCTPCITEKQQNSCRQQPRLPVETLGNQLRRNPVDHFYGFHLLCMRRCQRGPNHVAYSRAESGQPLFK
jgi:hypothetical protein